MNDRVEICNIDTSIGLSKIKRANIIIPAYNSAHRIDKVISNLVSQKNLPSNLSINLLVCVNGSVDDTEIVASESLKKTNEQNSQFSGNVLVSPVAGEVTALNTMLDKIYEEEEYSLNESVMIGVNDDVFPTQGSLGVLIRALDQNPDIGAIGIEPSPIPTYKGRKGTMAEKVAYAMSLGKRYSIIGKMYGFQSGLITNFPEIMSEDLFLTKRSVDETGKFGIISDGHSRVYHRVPVTFQDLIQESTNHWRAALQFSREYGVTEEKLERIQLLERYYGLIKNRLSTEDGMDLFTKCLGIGILLLTKERAERLEKKNPSTSSQRERIKNTV